MLKLTPLSLKDLTPIVKALEINTLPENRVLIITQKEVSSQSGIIIPGSSKSELPKRGQIIQVGHIEKDAHPGLVNKLNLGDFVTYGLYAGKETEFHYVEVPDNYAISILSVNELLYVEPLKNYLNE